MLDIFRKSIKIYAPVSGKVLSLKDVPDEIFASRMVGEGIAIDATGDVIVAPADGEVSLIFKTNHAFGMVLQNDMELLVHIGIDTVGLCGEGFKRLKEEGSIVKAGEPIIAINREFIKSTNYSLITPVVITSVDNIKITQENIGTEVKAGSDVVFTYKIK